MNPRVSICIPTYEQTRYLRRVLSSIESQRYSDYEIVITDDSRDGRVRNLLPTFHFQGKLIYHQNRKRLGSPANWNEAIRRANGEYIKVLHHDDWFADENSLGEFVELLNKDPAAAFAFSACQRFNWRRRLVSEVSCLPSQLRELRVNPETLFFGNFIGSPSVTIYRSSIKQEYDPKLRFLVDMDFYIRVLQANPQFQFSTRPLVCVTSDAPHQVTEQCAGNRITEVYEWLWLYRKLETTSRFSLRRLNRLRVIFKTYGIRSRSDLADCGVDYSIPRSVKMLLLWQNIFRERET